MGINTCPYCSNTLLRHARQKGVYWFCTSCWQEVPSLLTGSVSRRDKNLGQPLRAKQSVEP